MSERDITFKRVKQRSASMAAGLNVKCVCEYAARVRMQPTDVITIPMLSEWGPYMCKIKPH